MSAAEQSVWTTWQCPTCNRGWEGNRPRSHLCPDGTLYVSSSTLASACDLQKWLRGKGASIAEENVAAQCGSAFHLAAAYYYRGAQPATAQTIFAENYQAFADVHVDPNGPLARLTYENTSKITKEWMRRFPLDKEGVLWTTAASPNPLLRVHEDLVEVPFMLTLSAEHRIVVIGILDALVEEYHSGQWLVQDHKTTGRLDKTWWRKWMLSAQITCYVWAGREMSDRPVQGAIINGVQMDMLPSDPTRKCYLHKVKYAECGTSHAKMEMVQFDRSEQAVADWKREATLKARELRQLLATYPALEDAPKLRVQGRFNDECLYCFGSAFCAGDRVKPVGEAFTMAEGMISA